MCVCVYVCVCLFFSVGFQKSVLDKLSRNSKSIIMAKVNRITKRFMTSHMTLSSVTERGMVTSLKRI